MKYTAFFAAYNASVKAGNPNSREDMILEYTNGRTASLKDLTINEIKKLTDRLNAISGFTPNVIVSISNHGNQTYTGDRMRKAIIAIFKSTGRSTDDAIKWAEKQGITARDGSNKKKKINEYTNQELHQLIALAEKIRHDQNLAIRRRLVNG